MTCREIQDRLPEYFGATELPDEIHGHLVGCEECRAIWKELSAVAEVLPADEEFYPTDREVSRILVAVNEEIDRSDRSVVMIFPVWLQRVLPVAASILLVASLALLGGRFDAQQQAFEDRLTQTEYAWYDTESTTVTSEDLDESTVRGLLEDFSNRPGVEPSEMLLDDLTEDELEYLNANFDVGDLL